MTPHEPESANRWATEHYGFDEDAATMTDARLTPRPRRGKPR